MTAEHNARDLTCPATTFDFGEVVRCELPEGHEGLHQGGCIGWRTPAVVEGAVARERRIAYGVALDGLGATFDPDASPLTLLLQVQQETARHRALAEAVADYLSALDAAGEDPPGTARLRELCPVMTLRDAFEAINTVEP